MALKCEGIKKLVDKSRQLDWRQALLGPCVLVTKPECTITYKVSFFCKDREAVYKEAWDMLERRG